MSDHEAFYIEVGKRIRSRRDELKIPQETLASDVGLTRTSITNIEKGRQKLLLHTFFDIARTLKTEPGALLPTQAAEPSGLSKHLLKDVPEDVRTIIESLATGRKA
jgi:DNA-binding XRE family transcriptional regulator